MVGRQPKAPAVFTPRRNHWYSLSEAESTTGHMVLSGQPRKKIPRDTTGNRSRDRPTSSVVHGVMVSIKIHYGRLLNVTQTPRKAKNL